MTGANVKAVHVARAARAARYALVIGLAGAVPGGCMLNPEVPSPMLDVPASFSTSALPRGDQGRYVMAFEMFRSKPLVALVTRARGSNMDIAAAVARIEQAEAQVRIATQPLIPLLDFGGDARQSYGGQGAGRGMSRHVSASLSSSYEIDFWGKNRAGRAAAARAALNTAKAQRDTARTALKDADILAPADGVILTRAVEPGAIVAAGATVYTLSLRAPVWVRAYVGEPDLGRIHPGMAVKLTTDTRPDAPYEGQIGFISPQAEFTPKTVETHKERVTLVYRIKIDVSNPNHELKPGMPADATLEPAVEKKE